MKNKLITLALTLFMANTATATSDLIFKSGFEIGASFELPIVIAAGSDITSNFIWENIIVSLEPDLVDSAKYIHMTVHNLQRLPNDEWMAALEVRNDNGRSGWIPLNNKTGVNSGVVVISEQAQAYGGIGGGFSELTMRIDVADLIDGNDERLFLTADNTFRFILNKKAYAEGASAYRVTELTVSNDSGASILAGGTPRHYEPGNAPDAATYIANDTPGNINAGKNFWENKALTVDSLSIRAKCMDCHTRTGYDLKYFGYTNESIYKRSRFHGFNDDEAKKLTLYIRNLDTPAYGRPWNPPYQPGEVNGVPLSDLPVARWAAGAGSSSVLEKDEDMLGYVFPDTNNNGAVDQADVDDAFQLSQVSPIGSGVSYLGINLADVPIHLQLPDWNRWLPRVHPLDIWADFHNVTGRPDPDPYPDRPRADPYGVYSYLVDQLNNGNTPGVWRLSRIMNQSMNFSAEGTNRSYITAALGRVHASSPRANVFRDASRDNTGRLNVDVLANSSAPYRYEMFDEKAKLALLHWNAVKYFEVHHVGELEAKLATIIGDPKLAGARGWGSWTSAVFHIAPHKIARNARYLEGRTNTYDESDWLFRDGDDQSPLDGDYASTVWYQLEAILNSGNKQKLGCCGPVDWAYNYAYYKRLASSSGRSQAMIYVATLMKEWQARNITATSLANGTLNGLNLRTATPTKAYATYAFQSGQPMPNSDTLLTLDEYSPNLYLYFLNTTLRRWMQVVKHPDFPYRYSTNNALNKLDDWPRSASANPGWGLLSEPDYVPSGFSGPINKFNSQNSADSFWRLLPLLSAKGVDATLLEDFKNWCKAAWPGLAGINDWDSRITDLIFADGFE